jgi:WD40-like Beta Propeller Repeat
VRWSEGNSGARDAAVRGLVGHWKRLAVSAWAPSREPLRVDVSLYGPTMGSGPPHVRLSAGRRTEDALSAPAGGTAAPVTDVGVLAALVRLKADRGDSAIEERHLMDDGWPRLSPDGRWLAFRTWRSGAPEVWLASADARQVYRCVLPPTGASPATPRLPVGGELIDAGPDWSPDGRAVAWVQGGRLCQVDAPGWTGRVLTPADAIVRAFVWSPNSRHAVLELEDGRMAILDRTREIEVPFHELLPQLVPSGDYAWSPSGRKLLFRAQGGVSSANFARPNALRRFLDRAIDVAMGRAPRPAAPLVVGDYRDRLAIYDLAGQRVTTLPLDPSADSISDLRGAAWSPGEDQVTLAARSGDGRVAVWSLSTDPLRLSARMPLPEPIARTGEAVHLLGWRRALSRPRGETGSHHFGRLALLAGEELFLLQPGRSDVPAPAGRVERDRLTAGPDGGYHGVAAEEETEEEPGLWLALEDAAQSGATPRKARFSDEVYASIATASPPSTGLRALLQESGVVDLDLQPASGVAVAAVSRGGGVGELVSIEADGTSRSLTRILDAAAVAALPLRVAPFTRMGPHSGAAALASAFQPPMGGRWGGIGVAVVVLALALLVWRRARRARRL